MCISFPMLYYLLLCISLSCLDFTFFSFSLHSRLLFSSRVSTLPDVRPTHGANQLFNSLSPFLDTSTINPVHSMYTYVYICIYIYICMFVYVGSLETHPGNLSWGHQHKYPFLGDHLTRSLDLQTSALQHGLATRNRSWQWKTLDVKLTFLELLGI